MEQTTTPDFTAAIAALRDSEFWDWFASHRHGEDIAEAANSINEIAAEYLEHLASAS